jgi:hypothetical protein
VSTLLHANVYMFLHNLLKVLVQIANKMGLQKNLLASHELRHTFLRPSYGRTACVIIGEFHTRA